MLEVRVSPGRGQEGALACPVELLLGVHEDVPQAEDREVQRLGQAWPW